jgi:hypothetical protein
LCFNLLDALARIETRRESAQHNYAARRESCEVGGVLRRTLLILGALAAYGTPEAQVRQFLKNREFTTSWTPGQDSLNRAWGIKFSGGTRTVQVLIGDYRSPFMFFFETSTEAFYGFDDSGRLVDIRVRKSTDAF